MMLSKERKSKRMVYEVLLTVYAEMGEVRCKVRVRCRR